MNDVPTTADRTTNHGCVNGLAACILRLSNEQASTPVLVLPVYLSLRDPFFVALASELARSTDRAIRFDWCRPGGGFISSFTARWARFRSTRLTRALSRVADACVVVTATIGRPGGPARDLVIGLCDETLELPTWTTAIRIG